MKKALVGVFAALLLGLVPAVWAQGNVYGTITDASGAVLPGANVNLASSSLGGAPHTTTTGKDGDFRFLNVDHGNYKLTVSMQGFATLNRDVIVTTGVNVTLSLAMKISGVEESINVTAETPVVDTKRSGTESAFNRDELEKIPQGRDPWAMLNRVPGVQVDRVSVAGSEAGQQSLFVAKGAQFTDTTWNLDGVVITDTTSYGASSMYFDFDAFDEISVSTGGTDIKNPTGGIGLNFVTKRGTNQFHGSLRGFFSNHKAGEASNTPAGVTNNLEDGRADQIRQIADYGADLGGPLIKDKLWFWGSYGRNDIRLYRFINASDDRTVLENFNAKVNWQASSNDMVSFFFFNGLKNKYHRDSGFTSNDSTSFTWNQGSFYQTSGCGLPCGMHGLFKVEDNHTFSPNFFLNAKYSFFNWGYGFDPVGGANQDASVNLINSTATGSWHKSRFLKPWHTASADGEVFADGLGGRNEIKFGFMYRHWPNVSSLAFSGDGLVGVTAAPVSFAWITRPAVVNYTANYAQGYIGDTFTRGRLTVNAGLRYDHQSAVNDPSTAAANPAFPNLVPALTFNGGLPGITWNDVTPRVGITVALDDARKTVLRASYARYAGQLSPPDVTFNSPVAYGYTFLAYQWKDLNGDGIAQPNEILTNQGALYGSGLNPANPTSATAINTLDPNYHANHDNEVIVGVERELVPDFSLSAAYTWRKGDGLTDFVPRIDANGNILPVSAFNALAPVSANGYTVTPYAPNPNLVGNNGRTLTNRPNYYQQYNGFELVAYKRLSHKWMMRVAGTIQSWTEHFGAGAFQNPTPTDYENFDSPNIGLLFFNNGAGPLVQGGVVAPSSYGSSKNSFFNATWQLNASGLYQLPGGFELGASIFGRQGYPKAIVIPAQAGGDGNMNVVVGPLDQQRYQNVWDVDFRLAKNFKLGGSATLGLTVDAFNIFNSGTVIEEVRQATSSAFGNPIQILNPAIVRYGLRLSF